jgi:hypothetical protein
MRGLNLKHDNIERLRVLSDMFNFICTSVGSILGELKELLAFIEEGKHFSSLYDPRYPVKLKTKAGLGQRRCQCTGHFVSGDFPRLDHR